MQLIAAFTRARTRRLLAGIVERVIMIFLVTPRTQLLAFLWTHWRACAGHTGVPVLPVTANHTKHRSIRQRQILYGLRWGGGEGVTA